MAAERDYPTLTNVTTIIQIILMTMKVRKRMTNCHFIVTATLINVTMWAGLFVLAGRV